MMKRTHTSRPVRRHADAPRHSGFSLMEVLVALGIFTVGLVAVAAIFPTAITIQRDTVREVDGRRIGKNAKALALAISRTNSALYPDDKRYEMSYRHNTNPALRKGSMEPFIAGAVGATASNPTPVMPMVSQFGMATPVSFGELFHLDTRSYPKNIADPLTRDYYWYPLIQVSDLASGTPEWNMIIIVMHRNGMDRPPLVRQSSAVVQTGAGTLRNVINFGGSLDNDVDNDGIPDFIQAGDQILGNDGQIHRVILADKDTVTVNSPNLGSLSSFYYAVAMDRSTGNVKSEVRSPIVWIEDGISLSINP